MRNKLIKFACVLCMLFSCVTLANAESLTDIQESKYQEEINTICGLGIMEETDYGIFSPDEYLTREDAAKAVARLMAFDGYVGKSMSYSDVPEESSDKVYIDTLASMGIMVGYDDKYFGYGEAITKKQFQSVLLRATGYMALSDIMSFEEMLNRSEIMDGISIPDGNITRESAAIILHNALETEEISHNLSEAGGFEKNGTVLENRLKLEKIEGVVTGNSITRLSSVGGVGEGCVEIDSVKYDVVADGADELLGYPVVAYYSITDDEIRYMYRDEAEYDVIEVYDYDIAKLETDGERVNLTYQKGESTKKETFTIDDNILKNGSAIAALTNENIAINMGKLVVVELKNGLKNVFIESYTNYIVEYVNTDTYTIVDRITRDEIDLNPENKKVTFNKFGYEVEFEQIGIGDVLSVYDNSNEPRMLKVYISDDKEEGSVTNVDEDYVYINAKAFRPAKGVELGKYIGVYTGIFYIDCEGRVAGLDETLDTSVRYGYLIKMLFDIENQDGEYLRIWLLNDQGSVDEYLASKKIKIDDQRVYDDWESFDVKNYRNADGSHKGQVVKYQLNHEGRIARLYTENMGEQGPKGDAAFKIQSYRRNSMGMFYNNTLSFFMDADTVIFTVPSEYTEKYSKYSIKALSSFLEMSAHNCKSYDLDDYKIAGAVVITSGESVDEYSKVMAVNSVYKTINADDDEVYCIKGVYDKKEVQYELSDEVTGVKKGDIMQINVADDGVVVSVNVASNAETQSEIIPSDDFHNDFALGTLYGIEGDYMRINYGSESLILKLTGNTSYYTYSKDSGRFEVADKNSMKIYKNVFVKITTGLAVDVISFD